MLLAGQGRVVRAESSTQLVVTKDGLTLAVEQGDSGALQVQLTS